MIAFEAFISVMVLIALLLLFYGPWQSVCTDYARQVMFEKRDAVFDIAARGDLSFKSKEYRTIRATLESSIRFAHEATLPRIVYYFVVLNTEDNAFSKPSAQSSAISSIEDARVREEIEHFVREARMAMLWMMLAKSIWTWLLLPIVAIMVAALFLFDHLMEWVTEAGEYVQVEAEKAPAHSGVHARA
ncbi:hypothetical protein [uncultured Nitratireductor sp.]|uniref:hypothetical protein n=1 Tax=uncultured Nitratireductor sp. TaxID=520953 RepID=UPI0025CF21E2|nr:hypothetical protein [uncultured Nitratireductor sp.]